MTGMHILAAHESGARPIDWAQVRRRLPGVHVHAATGRTRWPRDGAATVRGGSRASGEVGIWNATGGAAVVVGMSEGPKRPPTLLDDAKTVSAYLMDQLLRQPNARLGDVSDAVGRICFAAGIFEGDDQAALDQAIVNVRKLAGQQDADHGITIPRPMGDLRLLVAEFSRSLGVQS